MKRLFLCICLIALDACALAQTVNVSQQVTVQGLRATSGQGSFRAAKYAADGSLILLYDQGDGVRVLKSDANGNTVLAQTRLGATGDSGVAMALDPAGNVYVTGTTISGVLSGTSGAAFPNRADASTNSFLAKYDANLNLIFLTFLGSGRTAAASVTATSDAVFVTGVTFNAAFPVTPAGIQQNPALNSSENGFVECFTANGSSLRYATYLTGANGNTVPTAIVSDTSDNAYIVGSTSATGYPTLNALQPSILGSNSGFLSKLTPAGDGFVYSTFIAGAGITGLALDVSGNSLLLTGNVSIGQFPVDTVSMPLTSASYQTLVRIPTDGQSILSSVLLVPGALSFVSAGPNGDAWISGSLTTPLFPGTVPPDYNSGDSYLLHLASDNSFDQTLRFGGTAINNPSYASLTSTVAAPAVNGKTITVPGAIQATVAAPLLSTQRFDLPLVQAPNAGLLSNSLRDALPSASMCNSQCNGFAALLATVNTSSTAPSLSLSTDNLPNLILRNLGSGTATQITVTANGFSFTSNCGVSLAPSSQCSINLVGSGPGSVTVSSANATVATAILGQSLLQPNALALSATELDFGIATPTSPGVQTLTVTNLSASNQTFSSALDGGPNTASTFTETASDCASGNATGQHTLSASSSCHITLTLTASNSDANDGPVRASWKIGAQDIVLTGVSQASALNISASEIDFGTHFAINNTVNGINLPRYLYLSNNSSAAVEHTTVALAAGSAFSVNDSCPSVLPPHSVCQMKVTYSPPNSPSQDADRLSLDGGESVVLTGITLPPASVTASSTNPSLGVSTTTLNFSTPVVVSGVASTLQSISVKNNGASPFPLSISVSGDYELTNGCPSLLAGGMSCTLLVGFAPSQPGTRLGLLGVTAGTGFAPTYVSLSGMALPLLPANNGILDQGESLVGEPTVTWYKIQQPLASLSVSTNNAFSVALVEDTGGGHGLLPAADFSSSVTAACGNCWLGVQFSPRATGLQSGTLTLSTTTGGNPYTLTLTGTAVPVQGLILTPITRDFGTIDVSNASQPITFTLANLLVNASGVTIQSASATGDFTVTTNQTGGASCSGVLPATASCFVQVTFSPTATGERSGTLNIVTSAGTVQSMLTGYGAADPGVAISPSSLDFENTPGSSATQQSLVVSNTGSSILTIGVATTSDPSFTATSACSTLTPGSLCSISVSFSPQTAPVTATVSIPITVTINGQTTTTTYTAALNGGFTISDSGLQILPSEVNFGSTSTGLIGGTRQFTLNNLSGKQLNVTLRMPRQFPLVTGSSCSSLAPGGSCTFSVNFLPITDGPITGSVYAEGISTDNLTTVETLTYMLGYGAGSGTLEINGLPIPYSPVNFGQVSSGQSASYTLTLSNSGSSALNIRRISSAPPFLSTNTCGSTLNSGSNCTVTVTYAPVYQLGSGSGSLAARGDSETLIIESDAASSPDMVTLSGMVAPMITTSPSNPVTLATYDLSQSSLTFANTQVGSSSVPQVVTMTNTGTTNLHIGSILAPSEFLANTNCSTLLVGASCQITVRFAPASVSISPIRSGALQILSDAGTSLEFVSLIGFSSAAPLTFNPTSLSFGSVNVGSSVTLGLTVTNTMGAPITFLGYATSSNYTVSQGSCPAIGSTLASGSSCSVNISFTPNAAGSVNGSFMLTTDATTLPLNVALSGTGVQVVAPAPSFVLTVDGGSVATQTIASGSPAVYSLLLTPLNGFAGPVALTCTPVAAATYASCSLLSSTLTLNGSALASTATINTITTAAIRTSSGVALLLLGPMLFWRRRRRIAAVSVTSVLGLLLVGCGSTSHPPAGSDIQRTPPGTYQYQVTASSTTGTVVSSTVTLNLIVQ